MVYIRSQQEFQLIELPILKPIYVSIVAQIAFEKLFYLSWKWCKKCTSVQVHGLLHLLGFDHEISDEAEKEMENEEEKLLRSLEWKGKGLIQSAYDAQTNEDSYKEISDGNLSLAITSIV